MRIEQIHDLMIESFKENKTFSFPINGTSMQPLLHKNDLVELTDKFEIKKNDILFYKRLDNTYVLHRVVKIKGDVLYIVGDHQVKKEIVYENQLIAKAISYTKKNKKYFFKGIKYKIYLFTLKFYIIRKIYSKFM